MSAPGVRLAEALARIDAANAADPRSDLEGGVPQPKELLYGRRMSAWLDRLHPDAPDELRIAVRAQHLRRWEIPRESYPMDRTGYLTWRKRLYRFHAEAAAEIMRAVGYGGAEIERAAFMLQKKQIKHDAGTQALEDCACLVFLEHHFAAYVGRWDDAKFVEILRKTWAKMSDAARAEALRLPLEPAARRLVAAALDSGGEACGTLAREESDMPGLAFALQLYSVRDHLERDPASTLAAVKAGGYDHVELAGTAGLEPAAFKDLLDAAGLRAASAHVSAEAMAHGFDAVVAGAKRYGLDHLVVPWLEPSGDHREWESRARMLAGWGAALRAEGIRFAYHNHDHEFRDAGGATPFEILFDTAPPEDLAIQLDIGWARYAGVDLPALFARHAGRMPTVHCKQFALDGAGAPYTSELAEGIVDYASVVRAARAAGTAWFIVEQDDSKTDSLASAAANARFMRGLEA